MSRPGGALGTILLLDAAAFALFALVAPGFASVANLQAVALSALALVLLASGQTLVLITGGIDLAAPAIVGLASVTGALVMGGEHGLLAGHALAATAGVAAMLAAGAVAGAANGAAVGLLRMPPFMATLTMATFASGLAIWMARRGAGSETIYDLPRAVVAMGATPWLMIGVAAAAVTLAHVVLERTALGRSMRALGHNARTARVSGVPVARVTLQAYAASGLLAALASFLLTAQLETASPAHGRQLLLDVIGASVIGGTSLAGGIGTIASTTLGVVFLALVGNGLTLLNLSDFTITIVKGLVILGAALLDVWRRRGATA